MPFDRQNKTTTHERPVMESIQWEGDQYDIRLQMAWIIEQYLESLRAAVSEGDINKYYNITIAGLDPLLSPYYDEKYAERKEEIEKQRQDKKIKYKKGGKIEISHQELEKINYDYAVKLFFEIMLLLKRRGMTGAKLGVEEI